MEKFLVLREHLGDKPYAKGDARHARRADVQHLIANGVLGDFPQEIIEDSDNIDKPVDDKPDDTVTEVKDAKASKKAPETK